jgi:Activator of Hsp90 ATPase homolog 1-like protein
MSTNALASVTKSVVVNVSQQRAFDVFTTGFDSWWPRSHHLAESPLKEFVMEPREGGGWYGICEDGTKSYAGRVLRWDPPNALTLAWQITGEWQYDPDFVTEVDVHFIAEAPDRTRVELEHRNLDRHGDGWEQMRDAVGSPDGWGGGLRRYAAALR